MSGLIRSLSIAQRSLMAHQETLAVIGHNIANVSTPGYSRRVAELSPTPAIREGTLTFGTGVEVAQISRRRNAYLDREISRQKSLNNQWSVWQQDLQRLEALVGEPSDNGLGAVMDAFFDDWTELANQPESDGLRYVLVQEGERLSDRFQNLSKGMKTLQEDLDFRLEQGVNSLNQKLSQIAELNATVRNSQVRGDQAPDLRDQRDRLMEEVASITGAVAQEREDGVLLISMDGVQLVGDTGAVALETRRETSANGIASQVFANGRQIHISGGEFGGILQLHDEVIPDISGKLDNLALALVQEVNRLHSMGPDGIAFFSGTTAGNIQVSDDILLDPTRVNAGTTRDPGENDISVAIASLQDSPLPGLSGSTPSDYWTTWVGRVGTLSRRGEEETEASARFVESLEAQREAITGVNLDEEMMHLVMTERAFQAAARVFSTADDMLSDLLSI
ncbi:MAG: flagellar hook-associated protein FlgK [Candidatus Eisenbacteria bacterium]|uniref:Flagellar hook-associated protein 1 n=1 Tax=Eiseniibacteriota bacterium TaxID=2212470 RepID=A0A948S096_UNCEI|nr:flagellar hook-associated protein FlgK [Candidatus Eisenbacteria bacterium]MBU1949311.1 flagellar hook-associated protein FlgK [Candidatus Eisenbacteria bacterium]MBU2692938.1 flagellar hook-associated protein FlgK [Candidatus Eisenbacteria bacterium]